jgi:hypothetical protein
MVSNVIGLGMTHYPMITTTDEHMASLLRGTLKEIFNSNKAFALYR